MVEKKAMKKGHAIMISVPAQGHINPFVSLALKLASKGITITFVHLEIVHHKISQSHANNEVDIFSEARQSGLDIRYTTIGDGLPLDYNRDNVMDYWYHLFYNFEARVEEFVGNLMIQSSHLLPNMLVTDTIYAWSANIAKKFNLLYVSFWTQPALIFSLIYHLDLLKENGHFLCKDNQKLEIDYIPGVQSMSAKDLMPVLRDADDISGIAMFTSIEQVKKADFILYNTVQELEFDTLSALNKYQPTYAIGPINFSKINSTVSKSLKAESDCARWLDSKPPGSVLYVSFGSVVQTSKQVIEEMAHGLLLSGVNFIWVVRAGVTADSADADVLLPSGFVDEVKDRGLIVPWCDQIMVLSSPGVGGFLTHCGWNSTIESMWCGVPMICYPITYDQPTNRKLVIDDWKIGINLSDEMSIDRNEVAEKIKSFMSENASSRRMRQEARNVKQILRNALDIHGSSEINFDQFMKDLEKKLFI
ncbi:hypothetical protein ACS0TY_015349 [Phlomoides rotata]